MGSRAISRAVWAISVPIVFAETSETIVHVTDTAFLARVGVTELGAIAIADSIYEMAVVPVVALVDGIQILTARRAGQRRPAAVGATFNQGLGLLVLLSLALTVGLVSLSPWLTGLLVTSPDVAAAADTFLGIIALGTVFHAANLAYSVLFMALGRTQVLIPATILLAVTNLVLDYALVLGRLGCPPLGIAGAAWGSLVAEIVTCAYLTWYAFRHLEVGTYGLFRMGHYDARLTRSMGTISTPVGVQALLESARWFLFFLLAEHLGERTLAASNVIYSIFALLLIPSEGFAETACSMASRLIGRGHAARLGSLVWEVIRPGYLVTLPVVVLVLLFPGAVLGLLGGDPEVVAACIPSLRVIAAAMLVVVPAQMWFAALSGTGDTRAASMIELTLSGTMLGAAALAGLALRLPLEYIWLSVPLSWLVCLALSYAWIRTGRWQRVSL